MMMAQEMTQKILDDVQALSDKVETLSNVVDGINNKIISKDQVKSMIDDAFDGQLSDAMDGRLEDYPNNQQVSRMIVDHITPIHRIVKEQRDETVKIGDKFDEFKTTLVSRLNDMDSNQQHNRRDIDLAMEANRKQDEKFATYKAAWDSNTRSLNQLIDTVRGAGDKLGLQGQVVALQSMLETSMPKISMNIDESKDGIAENKNQLNRIVSWIDDQEALKQEQIEKRQEMKRRFWKAISTISGHIVTRLLLILGTGTAVGTFVAELIRSLGTAS